MNGLIIRRRMMMAAEKLTSVVGKFFTRVTADGGVIKDGKAKVQRIYGNTVVFNQLATGSSVVVPSGHKYLSVISGTSAIATSSGASISVGATDQIFDLTQMFSGNEAAALGVANLDTDANKATAIANFRAMFPAEYYGYDAGSLLSTTLSSQSVIESYGMNIWDEEWEVGGLNNQGEPAVSSNQIRSKNFCPCEPNTSYYKLCIDSATKSYYLNFLWYDANKAYISSAYSKTQTSPSNAAYFKICTNSSTYVYGNEYHNDICINVSDASINGTYKPYLHDECHLPTQGGQPIVLRSAGRTSNAKDILKGTAITRYTSVRAYQAGDESNTDYLTDKTNTIVPLATPTEEAIDSWTPSYQVQRNGSERYAPDNSTAAITTELYCEIGYKIGGVRND